jgi:hypothetical protein
MSIKLMSMVWDRGPEKQADRFVLLAIADYANDDGECWPSIGGICRKTCMSERGVQTIIRRLEAQGWLHIETGSGRRNCNLYTIKTPQDMHPAGYAPPHMDAETPHMDVINPAPPAPEPSLTIKEPSVNNIAREVLCILSEWASPDAASSFIAYRKKQKGKALTVTAVKRQAKQLEKIFQAGGDPDDALGMAEERGWQSVQADWYFKAKESQNGNGNHNINGSGSGGSRNAMVDAFAAVAAERSARNSRNTGNG